MLTRSNGTSYTVRERILTLITCPIGRKKVTINYEPDRTPQRFVHQLVTESFIGARPPGLEVCHNNGDPGDNRLSNLRYGTRSENTFDRVRHGTHHEAIKTHCPQGHPYDEINTLVYTRPSGETDRRCRACRREQSRNRMRRVRAAQREQRAA